ncbi:hypothetical protein Alsa3_CDS0166 [Staphylococcus phage Alsa_3]|nr:hypothetical protein Alsa3_CDS0166 [Staphylococcus phage Alsa_3]WNM51291.1 hypothetical protein Alsa4_CDS0161 [Staphylococcus phage Alsa_4]
MYSNRSNLIYIQLSRYVLTKCKYLGWTSK